MRRRFDIRHVPPERALATAAYCALAAVAAAVLSPPAFAQPPEGRPDAAHERFERLVRPVLAEHCFKCHGDRKQEAGLRLDSRAGWLKGSENGPIVAEGKPGESLVMEALGYEGSTEMPPEGKLPSEAIAAISAWIEEGLPWPEPAPTASNTTSSSAADHWAFQPVVRPAVPVLAGDDWSRTPIDCFILQKLRAERITPAPAASRTVFIRRATFDLTGLPPTPAEVAAFTLDSSPAAAERLIERLLASPRFGERWGRHWLDVARYADNKGYVFFEDKNFPWAWAYRDYVVRAFNEDLAYDRFVLEQLAADQLDLGGEPWRLAALGFLTVGGRFMNNVHDVLDDRIDVVTRGLMGLTVTCARCHDHKYDPVPQADYYSLYGVFRSASEPLLPPLLAEPPETEEYRAFEQEMRTRVENLNAYIAAKHAELVASSRTRAAEYLIAAQAQRDRPSTEDFMLIADPGDLNPAMIVRWQVLLDKTRRSQDAVWTPWHALADLPAEDFAAESSRVLSELRNSAGDPAANPLVVEALAAAPLTSLSEAATRYADVLNRIETRWQEQLAAAQSAGEPSPAGMPNADEEQLRQVFHGPNAPPDVPLNFGWGFLTLLPDRASQEEFKKLVKEVETWSTTGPGAPPRAMALVDDPEPYEPRILLRGNPNRPGESVPRQFLEFLSADREPFKNGSGRLDLARAIADPANPLTARVIVNRIWMHYFGTGLVATPSDFGLRGETPTHPELLDWLAAELVDSGWSLKHVHRLIVTSATYRQSSNAERGTRSAELQDGPLLASEVPRSELRAPSSVDPENRLLWCMPRRRLDFEALRDALLAVSGSLDERIGGPPADIVGAGFATRRTLYGYIDRLDVPGLLTSFDFPNPAATSPQRAATTVAPQALFLMNGDFTAEAARRFAHRPDMISLSKDERLERAFLLAWSRPATNEERALASEFLGPDPSSERWEQFTQALLMANEYVFLD